MLPKLQLQLALAVQAKQLAVHRQLPPQTLRHLVVAVVGGEQLIQATLALAVQVVALVTIRVGQEALAMQVALVR